MCLQLGVPPSHLPKIANFFGPVGFPSGPWGRDAAGALEPARLNLSLDLSCVCGTSGVWLVDLESPSLRWTFLELTTSWTPIGGNGSKVCGSAA